MLDLSPGRRVSDATLTNHCKHTHSHTHAQDRARTRTHTHTHTHPHTHKHTHTHTHTLLHVINTSHTHAAHATPELPYDLLVDVFVDNSVRAYPLCPV